MGQREEGNEEETLEDEKIKSCADGRVDMNEAPH